MKKYGIIIVSLLLITASIIGLSVLAVDSPSVKVGEVSGKPGSTVQVTIDVSGNPGFSLLELELSWDKDKLDFESSSIGSLLSNNFSGLANENPDADGTFKYSGYNVDSGNISGDGTLLTLTFTIPEDSDGSAIPISVSGVKVYDDQEKLISVGTSNGNVSVSSPAQPSSPAKVPPIPTVPGGGVVIPGNPGTGNPVASSAPGGGSTTTPSAPPSSGETEVEPSSYPVEPDTTDYAQVVGEAKDALSVGDLKQNNTDLSNVVGDLNLPKEKNGVAIVWESDKPAVISSDGKVTRGEEDETVKLTATLSKGTASATKSFEITVKSKSTYPTDLDIVNDAKNSLTWDTIKGTNMSSSAVVSNLKLPKSRSDGVEVAWASSDETVVSTDGTVTRPASGNKTVTLTATISKGGEKSTKVFEITVLKADLTAQEKVNTTKEQLTWSRISSNNASQTRVSSDLSLPASGIDDTIIVWSSDYPEVISALGKVTQPTDADKVVTLTATITSGGVTTTKEFKITVLKAGTETTTTTSRSDGGNWDTETMSVSVKGGVTGYVPKTGIESDGWMYLLFILSGVFGVVLLMPAVVRKLKKIK